MPPELLKSRNNEMQDMTLALSKWWIRILALFVLGAAIPASGQDQFQTVSFPSGDGLEISADFYPGVNPSAPTVLLFHQSASSRGEFREIGPKLQTLGYNALAVDLRWGGARNGIRNETAQRFGTAEIMAQVEAGTLSPWPTIDEAYQDMRAALGWLEVEGYAGPRYVLGSSFSATLVYRLGFEEEVAGVLAYSPGEYDDARPEFVREWANLLRVPVLSVAAPDEEDLVRPIADAVVSGGSHYVVAPAGVHGASILDVDDRNWAMLATFLSHHTGGPPIGVERELVQGDGSSIYTDWYDGPGEGRLVALFHQGGGSARGEYGFLIPRLLEMGFDVVAADLPGGGDRFGFPNRTLQAQPEPDDFRYCDALPALEAVLSSAHDWQPDSDLVAWGSSYSGALVLHAAAEGSSGGEGEVVVNRVLAFSPASGDLMSGCTPEEVANRLSVPTLIVRPDTEAELPNIVEQLALFDAAGHQAVVFSPGAHGSSTLNPLRVLGLSDASWRLVDQFLSAGYGASSSPGVGRTSR